MLFWSNTSSPDFGSDQHHNNALQKKRPTPAEAARVRHLLTNIQYTLVSTNPQHRSDNGWESKFFEFCRVTLIIYSLTILNERPASTAVGQQVASTFRNLLSDLLCHDAIDKPASMSGLLTPHIDFYLWAIFLAATVDMYTKSDTQDWLIRSFAKLVSSDHGHVHDWHDLKFRLSKFLWVSSVHDSSSQWLWSEIAEMRRQDFEFQDTSLVSVLENVYT